MKTKLKRISCIILVMAIVFSIIYIIKYCYDIYNAKKQMSLLDEISVNKIKIMQIYGQESNNVILENKQKQNNNIIQIQKNERILKLQELQKQNSDIVGWIEIENTDINYPVLQGKDNKYYMTHNYKKEYSMNGSIFLDKDYVWNPPSSNLLIYGHNNKNGTMFQSLLKYKNKSFYNEHPIIRFTTNNEDSDYEIISVFESRVYYKSEKNVFRYYYFINAKNENEYNEYIKNAKKASLYDTKKTAVYGEQLITLSTCDYYTEDGRFVIVAKKK